MKSVLVVLLSSVVSAVVAASVVTVMAEGGDSAAGSRANAPLGDAFTYQGNLKGPNGTASGNHVMQFQAFDAEFGLGAVGSQQELVVPVAEGYFSVTLNLGPGVFQGSERWLEVRVKKSGDPILETLPRQLLSATPYALFAKKALTATSALTAATALNATTADSATTALTATNAVNATNATNATFATTALSANSATTALNATNATNAVNAATATNALNATNAVNAAHATTADAVAWGNVTGKPGGFNDDMDNDVLGALNCASGQVAKFNGTAWNCNADLTGGGPYNHFGESWSGISATPGLYVSNSGGGISILGSGGTGVQGQTALAYDGNGFAGVVGTNSGASCGATPPLGPFALDSHCIGGYFKAITSATGGIGAYGIGTMAGIVGEDGTGDGSGWGGYFLGGLFSQFALNVSSDARLKHAIQPLESQLPNVARLRPVTFEWNARPDGSHLGLIAQEVADIFPELVRTDPVAGYLTLNYNGLIPVLIKAMQEQQAEMAGLRASLSAEADETASSGEGRALPVAVTALVVSLLGLRMRPQVRRQPRHN